MSSEPSEKPKKTRHFLIRCQVEDLDGNKNTDVMDIVPGTDQQNAKDYVVGWFALRGFKVKDCSVVRDLDQLRSLVRNIAR